MSAKVYAPEAVARLEAAGYRKVLTRWAEDGGMVFEAYRSTAGVTVFMVVLTQNQRAYLLLRTPWEELPTDMALNPS